MRHRTFLVLFTAFLVLAASGVAWSQTVQGVITGTITDPSGASVPNATVTITSSNGQTAYSGSYNLNQGSTSFVWDGTRKRVRSEIWRLPIWWLWMVCGPGEMAGLM